MNCPIKTVLRMLAVGTPLIAIDSADHPDTVGRLRKALAEKDRPIVSWNLADSFEAVNTLGQAAIAEIPEAEKQAAKRPAIALHAARKLPEDTILIFDNLHWYWDSPDVKQSLLNLREPFKRSRRAVIGLTYQSTLPVDLAQNVCYVDDPLPNEAALADKAAQIHLAAYGENVEFSENEALSVAREIRGSAPFKAETLVSLAIAKDGIDRERLRDNARKQINDTAGLSVESTAVTFDDIAGLDGIREYFRNLFSGPESPTVVVRIEEIEKALAGVDTETSGTAGDALGTLLTAMEDYGWSGVLAYGVSGCGKSLIAKATANEFGAKAIRFDVNACRGSLVGESERQIRQAVDVLHAIGGRRVLFIASMNKISSLPAELRRRFSRGTWFFDVLDKQGRANAFAISCKQYGIDYDGYDAADLTGADIRDICSQAYALEVPCSQAARYVIPLAKAAPDAIADARKDAAGKYLCANRGEAYAAPNAYAETADGRQFDL